MKWSTVLMMFRIFTKLTSYCAVHVNSNLNSKSTFIVHYGHEMNIEIIITHYYITIDVILIVCVLTQNNCANYVTIMIKPNAAIGHCWDNLKFV